MIAIALNIAGNLALILTIGVLGPPLATAFSASANLALLYITLRKRGQFEADARLKRRLWRLALAAAMMGIALLAARPLVEPFLAGPMIMRGLTLAVLVSAGVATYAIACFVTGAFRLGDLKAIRKRAPAAVPSGESPDKA